MLAALMGNPSEAYHVMYGGVEQPASVAAEAGSAEGHATLAQGACTTAAEQQDGSSEHVYSRSSLNDAQCLDAPLAPALAATPSSCDGAAGDAGMQTPEQVCVYGCWCGVVIGDA